MLSKLIKHEFRATARIMWPIFGGMLILTVLTRFGAFEVLDHFGSFLLNALSIITIIAFFMGMFALAFAPLIASCARFKQSLLGNNGYLTMTLPVSTNQLLLSKLITNAVWYAATAVLALLITAVFFGVDLESLGDIGRLLSDLYTGLRALESEELFHLIFILFELLINVVTGITLATLVVYASFAIGYSANKRKTLWTVLLIYGFAHVVSFVGVTTLIFFGNGSDRWTSFMVGVQGFESFLAIAFAVMLLLGAVFYLITHYFITHKLNLE